MKTQFLTIALLISILIMSASCSNNTNDNVSENPTNEIQSQIEETTLSGRYLIKDDLPEVTYDGYVFRVLTRDDSTHSATPHQNEVMVESLNGEIENDAIYNRNRAIEERFNIKIEMITVSENPESTLTDHFTRSVLANDDTFDLALPHMILGGGIASTGIMYNWHELPHVDFDKPWWNKIAVDEFTINDKLYLASSDYIKSSIYSTWVMFYNYIIGEKHNIPNIFDMIKSDNWTIDEFIRLSKSVSTDLNGDGVYDENDLYGYITGDGSGFINWMFALDIKVIEFNSDRYPVLVINNEKTTGAIEKVYELLYNGNSSFTVHNTVETSSDTIKKFARGEALFCARDVNGTQYLRDMEDEFGIVPFPKWDAAQEGYYTHVDGHSPLMCIPLTISDPEFVGTIIEALSAETYREVTPVILEVVLQSKYTRDEISYEMIELALKGRQYTFAYVYDDWKGVQWSFDNLMQNKSTDFVSYYEKNESAALAQIDKVMNAYLSID